MVIYNGGNFPKKNILAMDMFRAGSNCQEGPGVYFATTLEVARGYGDLIYTADVNLDDFVDSRADLCDIASDFEIISFLRMINELDSNFWSFFTDYGLEVESQYDLSKVGYQSVTDIIKEGEVRNILTELCESSSIEVVQYAWMKSFNKKGTYNKDLGFIAVLDINLKIKTL